jgi:hypothetical protein
VIATVVDWNALLDVVLYSLGLGVGLTIVFSLVILGAVRFADLREDRPVEAWGFAVLTLAGLVVFAGAVVLGIVVMTSK